ncbi:hypothetical protein B0H17DRAFT_1203560 [Mycena rosella]|uniref:Uncharacterized protein n=1 Tax=Mycena rosella TaxID=1033263 RepID=A0AAD7GG95_MYCRO|nr:hypothetical protein B0H17DRAFT_1203560 [Mycena rosella]
MNKIVGHVGAINSTEPIDYATLSACSLTARAFAAPSQRHLFHSFALNNKTHGHLSQDLTESPHLASYVRGLLFDLEFGVHNGFHNNYYALTSLLPLEVSVTHNFLADDDNDVPWANGYPRKALVCLPTLDRLVYEPKPLAALHSLILGNEIAPAMEHIRRLELFVPTATHLSDLQIIALQCSDSIRHLVIDLQSWSDRLINLIDLPNLPHLRVLTLKAICMPDLHVVNVLIEADYYDDTALPLLSTSIQGSQISRDSARCISAWWVPSRCSCLSPAYRALLLASAIERSSDCIGFVHLRWIVARNVLSTRALLLNVNFFPSSSPGSLSA